MAAATFESLNPSTGEVIESFPRSSADDVNRAVDRARDAWESWRLVPAPERGNILFPLGNEDCLACLSRCYEFRQPIRDKFNVFQVPKPFARRSRVGAALPKAFWLKAANFKS